MGIDENQYIGALGRVLLRQGKHLEGIKNLKASGGYITFDLTNGVSIN